MSDENEFVTMEKGLAEAIRAASGDVMSERGSLEVADALIAHYRLVSLAPGQIVVGPEPDAWANRRGVDAILDHAWEGEVRTPRIAEVFNIPVYFGPAQEADDV